MTHIKNVLLLIVCFWLVLTAATAKPNDKEKKLWIEWEINNPTSKQIVNHQSWQQFIDKYSTPSDDGLTLMNYAKVTPQDHAKLKSYLKQIQSIPVNNLNRNQQLAFWLNVYNALVVNLVLEHYPIKSIQDLNISPGLFSSGPWSAKLLSVNGYKVSLNDIRNRIIRPIWNDPRTLYALCNSAIGAPNIPTKVLAGITIDEQLNQSAKSYINSLRGVQVIANKLIASQLYEWYEEDFGGTKQDVINHIKLYAKPELKTKLNTFQTINSYIYNWHINTKLND